MRINSVADYFIEHDLYQMFTVDRTLWFYGLVTIGVIIYKAVSTIFFLRHFFYGLMLLIGFVVTINIQLARVRRTQRLISINKIQILFFVVNILIVVFATIRFLKVNPGEYEILTDQWLVAGWEQLIFGIVSPFLLLLITRFAKRNRLLEIGSFVVIILLSSFFFAIAHVKVYGLDVGTLFYLFCIGTGLMALCYSISPSMSWSLHLLNNLLMLSTITN